jgi:uncharacterized protein YdhG (YjbR/CyaY superfamily)
MAGKRRFGTVDEYLRAQPESVQPILEDLRQTIRRAAPDAVETISYQMPTFKLNRRFLVSFAAWQTHIGLYPIPSGPAAFEREVSRYKVAKSTIRFPLDEPVPHALVEQLVMLRMKEDAGPAK